MARVMVAAGVTPFHPCPAYAYHAPWVFVFAALFVCCRAFA